MVSELVPSLVGDFLSLKIRGAEKMSKVSIVKVHFGALESILISNNTHIRELESPLPLKSLKIEAASLELKSTQRLPWFAENAVSLM